MSLFRLALYLLSENLRPPPNWKVCARNAHSNLVFLHFPGLSDLSPWKRCAHSHTIFFLCIRKAFLRDRTVSLVEFSKHDSRMRDKLGPLSTEVQADLTQTEQTRYYANKRRN